MLKTQLLPALDVRRGDLEKLINSLRDIPCERTMSERRVPGCFPLDQLHHKMTQ